MSEQKKPANENGGAAAAAAPSASAGNLPGSTPATIHDLLDVMRALRDPKTGCPWDKEQTFATIAPYTIEEAYEVADAIQRDDMAGLKEELGDLLLQVVYHSQIAEEAAAFSFKDVVEAITAKMVRRHPHVFGTEEERAAGVTEGFWERAKAKERAAKAEAGTTFPAETTGKAAAAAPPATAASILADVPLPLPALTRAIKLQNKAAKVGFDWPSLGPVFDKMSEEMDELQHEIKEAGGVGGASVLGGGLRADQRARIEEEYGDLLFVVANVARHLRIDPEHALRGTNAKFTRRFQRIEALLAENGKTPAESNLEEMEALWVQAKKEEKS